MSDYKKNFERGQELARKYVAARSLILGLDFGMDMQEIFQMSQSDMDKLLKLLRSDVLVNFVMRIADKESKLFFLTNIVDFKEILTPQVREIFE